MSELKTTPHGSSVKQFLQSIEDDQKRIDSFLILNIMQVLRREAKNVEYEYCGLGSHHYVYHSDRQDDWF